MDRRAGGQCVAPGTGLPRAREKVRHSGAHQVTSEASICNCNLLLAAAARTSCAAPPRLRSQASPTIIAPSCEIAPVKVSGMVESSAKAAASPSRASLTCVPLPSLVCVVAPAPLTSTRSRPPLSPEPALPAPSLTAHRPTRPDSPRTSRTPLAPRAPRRGRVWAPDPQMAMAEATQAGARRRARRGATTPPRWTVDLGPKTNPPHFRKKGRGWFWPFSGAPRSRLAFLSEVLVLPLWVQDAAALFPTSVRPVLLDGLAPLRRAPPARWWPRLAAVGARGSPPPRS